MADCSITGESLRILGERRGYEPPARAGGASGFARNPYSAYSTASHPT